MKIFQKKMMGRPICLISTLVLTFCLQQCNAFSSSSFALQRSASCADALHVARCLQCKPSTPSQQRKDTTLMMLEGCTGTSVKTAIASTLAGLQLLCPVVHNVHSSLMVPPASAAETVDSPISTRVPASRAAFEEAWEFTNK